MSGYIARGSEYEAPIPTTENDATLRAILQRLQYLAPQQGWRGVSVECDPYREIVLVTVRAEADGLSRELSRPYDRSMLVAMADPATLIAEEFVREFPKPDRVPFRNPMRDAPPPPANRARYAARLANVESHGPAWSAGTPYTDEEASVILGATEPRHALRERLASRKAAAEGRVVLEPSPRVTPGEPMPAATMPRGEWRPRATKHVSVDGTAAWSIEGGWLDAEVPPLGALHRAYDGSGPVLVGERYLSVERTRAIGIVVPTEPTRRGENWLALVAERGPRRDHAGPYDEERGWCPQLAIATGATQT